MRSDRVRRINDRGFSLVELLIAVAIATIVGGAIFGFMTVGAKNFSWNSAEVNLQNESQLAFNQMQELIIDTAVGVEYFDKDGASETKVEKDSEIDPSHDKLLRLNNYDYVYEIYWDRSDEKLYYGEYTASITGDVVSKGPSTLDAPTFESNYVLMSEYITGFAVDLSRLVSNRVVRVDLVYEKQGKTLATSHNITLRNQVVSSNRLEERIRDAYSLSSNKIPYIIRGKKVVYVEPGESLSLGAEYNELGADAEDRVTGYHVYDNNGDEIPGDVRFTFASGSGHLAGQTKVGNTTGLLQVSPLETAETFLVLPYSQTDNSIYGVGTSREPIEVRVVRDSAIELTFTAGPDADDEIPGNTIDAGTGDDVYKDDLKVNETFTLTATPDISFTVSKVGAGNLTTADTAKLNTIEAAINAGITYRGVTGYPAWFSVDDTSSLTSNPCVFKMSSQFGFSGNLEANAYREPISVQAYCGYSKAKFNGDVHADWNGKAYKKKSDYNIKPQSDVKRGHPYVTPLLVNGDEVIGSSGFSCTQGGTGDFWTNHCELVEIKVTERDFSNLGTDGQPAEREMDQSGFIRTTNQGGSEGANWTWQCPFDWSPNCTYEFEITSHIAHAKGNDANKCFVLPRAGYSKSDFEYTSNTIYITFDRFRITYSKAGSYSNVYLNPVPNATEGNYATYYAREFQKSTTPGIAEYAKERRYFWGFPYDEEFYRSTSKRFGNASVTVGTNSVLLTMKYSDSFIDNDDYANKYLCAHNSAWKSYEPVIEGGTKGNETTSSSGWQECTTAYNSINAPTGNQPGFNTNTDILYMFRYFKDQRNFVELDQYKEKWPDNPKPSRIKIVPLFIFNGNNRNDPYNIEDNYIECIFWNIRVPYKNRKDGTYNSWVELRNGNSGKYDYEECFFPGPEDPGFPGATIDPAVWQNAGFNDSGYKNKNGDPSYQLWYTLKNYSVDQNGWDLTLYYDQNTSKVKIAEYRYNNETKLWDKKW
ncbi:MAG: prepilin-type N-terminal cleavage/methylation domain-containing protein [Lachnospiraceae bacterium]|nr:prepilin-type N-terminal cleavage/methylation domain-containing protein [Lachnospiraceae bacterium]